MSLHDLLILIEENSLEINIIIIIFISIAKLNSILIINSLSIKDHTNFFSIIITARENFNQLYEAIAIIFLINSRSRLATSR